MYIYTYTYACLQSQLCRPLPRRIRPAHILTSQRPSISLSLSLSLSHTHTQHLSRFNIHVCVRARARARACVCVHTHIHTFVCTYMHVHISEDVESEAHCTHHLSLPCLFLRSPLGPGSSFSLGPLRRDEVRFYVFVFGARKAPEQPLRPARQVCMGITGGSGCRGGG